MDHDSFLTYYVSPTLVLPDGLTVIGSEAFTGLPADTVIRIPASVTDITADAFDPKTILLVPAGSAWVEWSVTNGFVPLEGLRDDPETGN